MALNITSNSAALMCSALTGQLNTNPGVANPTLVVYSGTPPVEADAALGGGNLALVTLLLNNTLAFQAPVDDGGLSRSTANSLPLVGTISLSGTATFFRLFNDVGDVALQGTVGTVGEDLNLDTVTLVQDATFQITSLSLNVPEQGA